VVLFLPIERVLWGAYLLAEGLVVLRLLQLRLLRRYPFFVAFLTVEILLSVRSMRYDLRSSGYAQFYPFMTGILLLFRFGVAAELYQRICDHFPGMGAFRKGMAAVLVLLAALIAVLSVRPNLANLWGFPVETLIVAQRFLLEILACVLLLTWIVLRFVLSIRQPFRPNVLMHWTIATVYFAAAGAAYLVLEIIGGYTTAYPVNSVMLAIQLGCFFAWILLMKRSGEQLPAFARLSADQVLGVENYNRELMGAVRSLPGEISLRQAEARDLPLRRARPL